MAEQFEFPINILCNPKKTDAAIKLMIGKAELMGDANLANQIAGDMQTLSSNKRSRVSSSGICIFYFSYPAYY